MTGADIDSDNAVRGGTASIPALLVSSDAVIRNAPGVVAAAGTGRDILSPPPPPFAVAFFSEYRSVRFFIALDSLVIVRWFGCC